MVIEWLGHSCFKVTLKSGTQECCSTLTIYATGYPQNRCLETDIAVISHAHHDHNDLSGIKGSFALIKTAGVHELKSMSIEGIATWHDHYEGKKRGENIVFLLKADGLKLCHMGDIGCLPSEELYQKIEGTDVLLIPVGGNYTIDAREALEVCGRVSPNIIMPMHFRGTATTIDLAPVEDFLEAAGREYDVSRPGKCYIEIEKSSLKKRTRIVVMEHI